MKYWFYALARGLLNIFFLLMPIRRRGLEDVPASGPVILCGNHLSMLDPLAVAISLKRPLRFMAKKELFERQPMRWIVTALGAYPVDRGKGDLSAIRTSLTILKQGDMMGIFPQGTRDTDGSHKMLPGVAMIALRSGATVIPMAFASRIRFFRRTRLSFGKPVDLSSFGSKVDSAALSAATEMIAQAIEAQRRRALEL